MSTWTKIALSLAFAIALVPGVAFAADNTLQPVSLSQESGEGASDKAEGSADQGVSSLDDIMLSWKVAASAFADKAKAAQVELSRQSKLLKYDPAAIEAIGNQEASGHTVCCPSYACAYADAVLDGTINDHGYYSCSCCMWTDWGGGNSSFRSVGSDEELLREAYDQIAAGKPTVIHVSWSGGEHWIALIGYENATDPDHLTLDNFIALDPWDGAQLNAGSKYSLYGDGCEHISDR